LVRRLLNVVPSFTGSTTVTDVTDAKRRAARLSTHGLGT